MKKLILILLAACLVHPAFAFSLWIQNQGPGQIDAQTVTTTVYRAFTAYPSVKQPLTSIAASIQNTAVVYVLYLPVASAAPANLAAMQANAATFALNPGDQVAGGLTDTSYNSSIYVASATGSQSVSFQAGTNTQGATALSVIIRASSGSSSGGGGGTVPTGATYENANSNGTPITTATTVQIFAAVASNKHHAWVQFSNSSTTGTVVQILDGSTVIQEMYCAPSGGGLSDSVPLALYGSTNTTLSIKVITAGASIYWTVRGFYATT